MKAKVIYFLQTKGWFSIYLLIIIIIGETSDILTHDAKFSISRYTTFILWYVGLVALWLVGSVVADYLKKD